MSEEYKVIELTDLDEATSVIVEALIHEGELRERERIIALLEANVCNIYGEFCAPEDVCMSREALISLIGGDNK